VISWYRRRVCLLCWSGWWRTSRCPRRPRKGSRGHPRVYTDRLFLKALVLMIVRRLVSVHELLSVLVESTPEMQTLRAQVTEQGRYPSRRTFERRLAALPATLPAQIDCRRRSLVAAFPAGLPRPGIVSPCLLAGAFVKQRGA
jgi:hypothetical protein